MATIQKRKYLNKTSYQVRIRRLGIKTITKSFMNRTDAKRWARNMETKLDRGDYSDYTEASKLTLGDIAKRYIDGGYHRKKKGARYEEYRYAQLLDDEISGVNLLRLSSKPLKFLELPASDLGLNEELFSKPREGCRLLRAQLCCLCDARAPSERGSSCRLLSW